MSSRPIVVEDLTADERIDLMGRLWDSLELGTAAPITPPLAAELSRREAEADVNPAAGESWTDIRKGLGKKLC
jgi:putative addiction module component (TIGR02574 family)